MGSGESPFPPGGFSRIREHLLGSLHVGRLAPGDRVPSVRRMAMLTGLDRKTVHRAYVRLALEGLLVTRPGSGTYLAPDGAAADGPDPGLLLSAAAQARDVAGRIGLDGATFARFLDRMADRRALAHVPLAVVECNAEQLGLIRRELHAALGTPARAVRLADVAASAAALAGSVRALVTTDCHRDEVQRAAGPHGLPVFRVALDPGHAEHLLRHARRGALLMVVRDRRYEGAFRRLADQLAVPAEVLRRIRVIEPQDLPRALREIDPPAALHVSPLLGPGPRPGGAPAAVAGPAPPLTLPPSPPLPPLPPGWRRVAPHPYLAADALDLLRAQLALLDARATGGGALPERPRLTPARAAALSS